MDVVYLFIAAQFLLHRFTTTDPVTRFDHSESKMLWQLTFFLLLHVTSRLSSYDITTLAMTKPGKYQRLADPLWKSGVVIRKNRV